MTEQVSTPSEDRAGEPPEEMSGLGRACHALGDCIQLLAVGMLLEFLLFEGTPLPAPHRLSIIAMLLIGVSKSKGWVLLVAIQVGLFLREPGRARMNHGLDTFIPCFVSVCLVAYGYRAQAVRRKVNQWIASRALSIVSRHRERTGRAQHRVASRWKHGIAARAIVLAASVLVAMILLDHLPVTVNARGLWLQRSVASEFALWRVATIVVAALALVVVVRETAWRRMTVAQASLYLRSAFMREHHRDSRMVVLRRLKTKKKAAAEESADVVSGSAAAGSPS